ncbi:STAS domain-containing protein [Streptomyces sp. NPDC058623]|uniref:STAS domain-containing protein n=1 Tax=Streptomyces sp. NPDC058623 TaxID=3346563 RepID=UPI003650F99B
MEKQVRVLPDAGGVRVIVCEGDFDADSIESLRSAGRAALTDPGLRRIAVDVKGLTFADSSVLNELVLLLRSGRLVLVGPLPRQLVRLFDLTGTTDLFTVVKSLEAVRAA